MSLPGASSSTRSSSTREQIEADLNVIHRMAEFARTRLETDEADSDFTLNQFRRLAKKLRDEIIPRLDSTCVDIDRLKDEAGIDRAAAEASKVAAEERLAGIINVASKIDALLYPTLQVHPADARALAAVEDTEKARQAEENAKKERDEANQRVLELQDRVSILETQLAASQAYAQGLENEAAVSNAEKDGLRQAIRGRDPHIGGTRRSAAEAELSSPEPTGRGPQKRPSIPGLHEASSTKGTLSKSVSTGNLSTRRPGVGTRKSSALDNQPPAQPEAASPPLSISRQRQHYDWEESFSTLVLPDDWDEQQRAEFKKQYSSIKNVDLSMQLDILAKNSPKTCLIGRIEKQKASLGGIPIENRSQCPFCSKYTTKYCVYLEDISDPDEETKRYLVKARP